MSATVDRVVLVANPAAGSSMPELVDELAERCRRWADLVWVHWTARHRPLDERLGTAADVVIAAGGDGTAATVAAALAATRAPAALLVLPAGTGNSCYRTMWGDRPWQAAVDAALSEPAARLRRLDLARPDRPGRALLSGASSGFSAQVVHAAADRSGADRYLVALAEVIGHHQPYPGRVLVDDRLVHSGSTMLANVGGSRYRGGRFELLPRTVLDDGLLDVCVIDGGNDPAEMVRLVGDGAHLGHPGVVYARGRRVRIERTDGEPLCLEQDGEPTIDPPSAISYTVWASAVPALVG